jgi:hypothetical protein
MDLITDTLTHLALNPFELQAFVAGLPSEAARAGLSLGELQAALAGASAESTLIANGDWAPCVACSDPADPDPMPFPPVVRS